MMREETKNVPVAKMLNEVKNPHTILSLSWIDHICRDWVQRFCLSRYSIVRTITSSWLPTGSLSGWIAYSGYSRAIAYTSEKFVSIADETVRSGFFVKIIKLIFITPLKIWTYVYGYIYTLTSRLTSVLLYSTSTMIVMPKSIVTIKVALAGASGAYAAAVAYGVPNTVIVYATLIKDYIWSMIADNSAGDSSVSS